MKKLNIKKKIFSNIESPINFQKQGFSNGKLKKEDGSKKKGDK